MDDLEEDGPVSAVARNALAYYAYHLPEEEALPLLMRLYKDGRTYERDDYARQFAAFASPGSALAKSLLAAADVRAFAAAIAAKVPDPAFAPALRKAVKRKPQPALIRALYACGAEDEAVRASVSAMRELLDTFQPGRDRWDEEFRGDIQDLAAHIEFLGDAAAAESVPLLRTVLRERRYEVLQPYAALALANIDGETALLELQRLYESGREDARLPAAWALHALGDERGRSLVGAYARQDDEYKYFTGLPVAVRSRQTDAAFLESIRNGNDIPREIYIPEGRLPSSPGARFFREHERELLAMLVERLSSPDADERREASSMLGDIFGKPYLFDYDSIESPEASKESIRRWREFVEKHLAKAAAVQAKR